jgi:uncharacterized Ntn-hydrolase superfamily protein
VTYSIVARDPSTGELGAAVQSHYFGTGRLVTWAEAGVGAVVTQSVPDIAYGPHGLDRMRAGIDAAAALAQLVSADPGEAVRQVAMIDATGRVAVHTGAGCVGRAGHLIGTQVSAQANMMAKETVWAAMVAAFDATSGDLAARLLAALEAAEGEGGDLRGRQSAAIVVVGAQATDRPWDHRLVDLRVDDHPEPLRELSRLIDYNRAFALVSSVFGSGILFAPTIDGQSPELEAALLDLGTAQDALTDNFEPTFWQAFLLAKAGRTDEARNQLKLAADHHAGWLEFLTRLPAAGLIAPDNALLTTG